jgi:O-antigen/teichoic acid export membrane protein
MDTLSEVLGGLLASNPALNLLGQFLPSAVGFLTIPYVIRDLGTDRYGVLAIARLLTGYISPSALVLGRATTMFVVECRSWGEIHRIQELLWTSLLFMVFFGTAAAGLAGVLNTEGNSLESSANFVSVSVQT